MRNKSFFTYFLVTLVSFSISATALASSDKVLRGSVLDAENTDEPPTLEVAVTSEKAPEKVETVSAAETVDVVESTAAVEAEDTTVTAEPTVSSETEEVEEDVCGFSVPEEKTYGAQLIAVRRKLRVMPEEEFRVKVFFKNTGSMPWFANKSSCLGPKISLGTERDRDRASTFYVEGLSGWESSNRVGMDQFRTDPGEIASFTFYGKAPGEADVLKEYWSVVAKDIEWINGSEFSFETMVGDSGESAGDLRKKMAYANTSGSVSWIDLNAEKSIHVDLSEQKLYIKLGDLSIREFRVSTGAAATPTPKGETSISLKQEVRVGAKPPHYIMPKYMMFRAGGYGFHSLPSLGRANSGVFWTEARSHIGIPVSHGCIRLLPEDAEWLFSFSDIGTKVVIEG